MEGWVVKVECQAGKVEMCGYRGGEVEMCVCQAGKVERLAVTLVGMWTGVLEMIVVTGRLLVLQLPCCEVPWCLNQGWKS